MKTQRKIRYSHPVAPLQDLSDEDLMEQFQKGYIKAFEVLIERYKEKLLWYVESFKGVVNAEDIVQTTFMRVYVNRHSYRRIAKFSTWLYTIAGNLAKSEYNRQKRGRKIISISANFHYGDRAHDVEIEDSSLSPEEYTDSKIQWECLQMAVRELSPKLRELIIFRILQQLTYEEIAEITGLPMGTVKSRINRGKRKLRRKLKSLHPFAINPDRDGRAGREKY